jgi:hypothetical protein
MVTHSSPARKANTQQVEGWYNEALRKQKTFLIKVFVHFHAINSNWSQNS